MALPFGIEPKDLLLLAIPIAFGIAYKAIISAFRPQRRIVWIDRSAAKLADLTRPEAGGLSLVFGGREIKQAAVRTIRIQNVGKDAARSADFEAPIRIELADSAALLNASIG